MKRFWGAAALGLILAATAACAPAAETTTEAAAPTVAPITAADVEAAQQVWGQGIVDIGRVHTEGGDAAARATEHINTLYAYEQGTVLFKPTLASADQFRGTFDEALSYFVGAEGTEDGGFAIAPYTNVRWENEGIITDSDSALAMGNYYFTGTNGTETKVEYTFGYIRDADGNLRINLHHSSLPFTPAP